MAASVVSLFSRLRISAPTVTGVSTRLISTQNGPLSFYLSNVLSGEPLKKRKKVDPAVLQAREQKRRRKLEKAIRRLEKGARKLKPVDEIVGDRALIKGASSRVRDLPALEWEESEARATLAKEWARYRTAQFHAEAGALDALAASQQRALMQLKEESEELYRLALQPDLTLTNFKRSGPVETPPIQGYEPPDGEYTDTTKTYD